MEIRVLFPGVFILKGRLCTQNLAKGIKVYDEELIEHRGSEYRTWTPYRSKLSAAILQGLKNLNIGNGSDVLYLGAATGTTSSHISDIVGKEGTVYCVEISERSMRELFRVCETRSNMIPIFGDARDTERYSDSVGLVDAIYQDVSSPDQAEILLRNSRMLKRHGYAYVAIKSQSIDVAKDPEQIYREFIMHVSKELEWIESVDIDRYDKKHLFVVFRKPGSGRKEHKK